MEPYNVLFLCTANSARSILAEAILNQIGEGRFRAFSAGSYPRGSVNPAASDVLRSLGHPVEDLRSKSWDEFAQPDAPKLDFVFTVCDNAAGEACPIWGIPDPAAVEGSDAEIHAAFFDAYRQLKNRISLFTALPIASIDRLSLRHRLEEIGKA
jgi:arsenate reductase